MHQTVRATRLSLDVWCLVCCRILNCEYHHLIRSMRVPVNGQHFISPQNIIQINYKISYVVTHKYILPTINYARWQIL